MIAPLDAKLVDINGDEKMEIIILDRFSDYASILQFCGFIVNHIK
jgi:hypothetical protein